MKQKLISIASLALLGGAMIFSSANKIPATSALAEDHTHKYINNVCECGARVFECEEGLIEGVNTSTDPNDKWINDFSSSDNPDHPVSGSGFVEYMAAPGNKITWKFNLSESLENVKCHVWISTGQEPKSTTALSVLVNGQANYWETRNVDYHGADIWYYFEDAISYSNFAKGNNTLVLINNTSQSFNFDCIEVEFPKTVTVGAYVDGQPDGQMPSVAPHGEHEPGYDPDNPGKPLDPVVSKDVFFMEGEYCHQIIGTNPTGDGNWWRETDNASGGATIANFGHVGDNIAIFKFTTDKAADNVQIIMHISTEASGEWADITIPRINGGSGGAAPFDRYPGVLGINITECGYNNSSYDLETFVSLAIPKVSILEGENTFEVEAWQGKLVNIDCIEFRAEGVTFSYVPMDRGFGGKGGPTSVEAELGEVKGTSSDAENKEFVVETAATSGRETSDGKAIGNFAVAGNQLKMYFRSNMEVKDAKLSLFVAPQGQGGKTSDIVGLTVNDEEKAIDQANFPATAGEGQIVWNELTISNITVKAGLNKIVLTNKTGENFLIDNIFIDNVPQSCNISTKNLDSEAPKVSVIKVVSTVLMTGKEIEFTFDYSDDFCEKEELKVSVKVFYRPTAGSPQTVPCTDNKFIPDYKGQYQISVTVSDKAGHDTISKRFVQIKYGEDKKEVVVKYVDKKKVGGWIVFGVGMGLTAGLVAFMVIAGKKKA